MADFHHRHFVVRAIADARAGVHPAPGNADRCGSGMRLHGSGAAPDSRAAGISVRIAGGIGTPWRESGVCSFMRLFVLFALSLPLAAATDEAREIVRRSVNVGDENIRIARNYTFRERNEGPSLDSSGRVTKT